jgi:hypothetical protein
MPHLSRPRIPAASRSVTRIALAALIAASCGGGGGQDPPAPASSLQAVGGTMINAVVGATVGPIVVQARDASGHAVAGATVTWSPSAGSVALASTTTDASGAASTTWTTGTTAGTQTLTAATASGAVTVAITATVAADRAAAVTIARDATVTLTPGASTTLLATVRDRFGNPTATRVTWSTSSSAIATVDSTGQLVALLPGSATITATADTAHGQTAITVAPSSPLTIAALDADTLRPGQTVTITGSGFVPNAMGVIVAGLAATVTSASPTQITAQLPAAAAFPCAPTGPTVLAVRRVAGSDTALAVVRPPLDVATRIALNVGERAVAPDPAAACVRLERAGSYVVSVFNTATTVPGGVAVQLRGIGPGVLAANAAAARATRSPTPPFVRSARAVVASAAGAEHARHLERDRARLIALGSPAPALARVRGSRAPARSASAAVPAVGDVVTLNAMYFDCATPTAVRARVAAVGTRSVVLEDVAVPAAGANDAVYRQIADEFDRVGYPIITQHFGDPLALDAKFGGDGRVRMLFTPYVADSVPNTIGFMTGCNYYARSQVPSSNEGAVFYARLPKPNESVAEWRYNLRSTIVHETKHLAAYAERFARAGTAAPVLEETWLEEATARVAEELYARTFSGATWKGNASYAPTVGCEVARCDDRPLGVYKHFEAVADFYSRVDSLTPLGGVSRFDGTFYGSGWLLTRWAADQFATDEPSFFRALTTETAVTGVQNLARRTGRTPAAMLPDWALAMAVDDRPGFVPQTAAITMPSWNTRDVFRGLSAYAPLQFRSAFPLLVRQRGAGSFTVDIPQLRSYTSAFAEVTAAPAAELLSLRAPNGDPASVGVGLAVVRVE